MEPVVVHTMEADPDEYFLKGLVLLEAGPEMGTTSAHRTTYQRSPAAWSGL